MSSKKSYRLLRMFIREQAARIGGLGSRNIFTVDDEPITWDTLPGYEVETSPSVDGTYSTTIFYDGKKLGYTKQFKDYEEARHYARMIIDKHRVDSGSELNG